MISTQHHMYKKFKNVNQVNFTFPQDTHAAVSEWKGVVE